MSLSSTLETTATNFLYACRPSPAGTNTVDTPAILSHTTPSFKMSWGHNHFISTFPPLQTPLTGPEWQEHMLGMCSNLRTWDIQVTDITVDEGRRKVVVRGDFHMFVKGFEDGVVNDILLILRLSEDGRKVEACTEFIDPIAGQELGKRMASLKGE